MAKDLFVPAVLRSCSLNEPDRRSEFVLEKKQAKYVAVNKEKKLGFVFQIDDSLISDKTVKKCDKGLYIEDKKVFLAELKGVDFNTACKQLKATYERISSA